MSTDESATKMESNEVTRSNPKSVQVTAVDSAATVAEQSESTIEENPANSFLFTADMYNHQQGPVQLSPSSPTMDKPNEQVDNVDDVKAEVETGARSKEQFKNPSVIIGKLKPVLEQEQINDPYDKGSDGENELLEDAGLCCNQRFCSCFSSICCSDNQENVKNVLNAEDDLTMKGDDKLLRTLWREFVDCFVSRKVPLHPTGRLRALWDLPLLIAVLYTILYVPFSVAWPCFYLPWIAFDIIVNVLFIMDIVVNFHTSFRNEYGDLEMSFRKCALNYLKTWFLLDLIASFPYDLILVFVTHENVPTEVLKFLKLFRLLRITVLVKYIMRVGVSVTSTLFVLLCGFILLCHWFGCLYFFLAVNEGLENSWVAKQSSIENLASLPQYQQYSTSFYWAIVTTATLGYGDVTAYSYAEQVFVSVVILIGALAYAVIIASVQQIVTWRFSAGAEYNRWMDNVVRFGKAHHLPPSIENKLVGYYKYVWERRKTFDNSNILNDLPFELRADVADFIHSRLFQANPVFCHAGTAFKHMLASKLGPGKVKLPDDVLFFEGEAVLDIVLVRRGALEMIAGLDSVDELIVSSRKDGQYCGDLGIFDESKVHYVSVVVTDYSDIHHIPAEDFLAILANFPRERLLFQRVADARKLAINNVLQKFRDHAMDWRGSVRNRDLTGLFSPKNTAAMHARALNAVEAELWKFWEDSVSPEADDLLCDKVIKLPVPASLYADHYGLGATTPRSSSPETNDGKKSENDEDKVNSQSRSVSMRKPEKEVSPMQLASQAAAGVLANLSTVEGFSQSPNMSKRRRGVMPFFPSPAQSSPTDQGIRQRGSSIGMGPPTFTPTSASLDSLLSALTLQIEDLERKVLTMTNPRMRHRQTPTPLIKSASEPDPVLF